MEKIFINFRKSINNNVIKIFILISLFAIIPISFCFAANSISSNNGDEFIKEAVKLTYRSNQYISAKPFFELDLSFSDKEKCRSNIRYFWTQHYFNLLRREITSYSGSLAEYQGPSESRTSILYSEATDGGSRSECFNMADLISIQKFRARAGLRFGELFLAENEQGFSNIIKSVHIKSKISTSEKMAKKEGCLIYYNLDSNKESNPAMEIFYRYDDRDGNVAPSRRQLTCMARSALISLGFLGAFDLPADALLIPDAEAMADSRPQAKRNCYLNRMLRVAPVAAAVADLPAYLDKHAIGLSR